MQLQFGAAAQSTRRKAKNLRPGARNPGHGLTEARRVTTRERSAGSGSSAAAAPQGCDGEWRTLDEIQAFAGGRESAVSARLRDLRQAKFGRYQVERRRREHGSDGNFEYRLLGVGKVE